MHRLRQVRTTVSVHALGRQSAALVFEQLCHSCGGCMAVCPTGAIREVERKIGVAQYGGSNGVAAGQGY